MIERKAPMVGEGGIFNSLVAIMNKYDIKPADIARALGAEPRTVDGWFEKPSLAVKRLREIEQALDTILTKKGIDAYDAGVFFSQRYYHVQQVADAMRNSVNQICKTLDPLELQTLESVAWSLYQQEHPYPYFYEFGLNEIGIGTERDEYGNEKVILAPIWFGDDILYRRNQRREEAERAHAEAEALANETIETTPDDPTGGRWDVYERRRNEHSRADRAARWRQWADTRPADMPMTPEFRQLLAILELEAPRDDQSGEAPMDPELQRLSAILQAEALTDDQTADDAQDGAEPTQ